MEEEFKLVLTPNCEPIYHTDGTILIQRSDGHQFYVEPNLISCDGIDLTVPQGVQVASYSRQDSMDSADPCVSVSPSSAVESPLEKHWSREEILQLITEFKDNKENFASTAIKNTKVWQNIANKIPSKDAKQCENKFKYLKAKYLKKVDNMSSKSSGAGLVMFEYFDEFNEIYAKQPIVTPIIASSSRDNDIEMNSEENNTTESAPTASNHQQDEIPTRNVRLRTAIINLNKILKRLKRIKKKDTEK